MLQQVNQTKNDDCWMNFAANIGCRGRESYRIYCEYIVCHYEDKIIGTAAEELSRAIKRLFNEMPKIKDEVDHKPNIRLEINPDWIEEIDGFSIRLEMRNLVIRGANSRGVLYGVFALIRTMIRGERLVVDREIRELPSNTDRVVSNLEALKEVLETDKKVIFYPNRQKELGLLQLRTGARLLASIALNGVMVRLSTLLEGDELTEESLRKMMCIANHFKRYDIKVYLEMDLEMDIQTIQNNDKIYSQLVRMQAFIANVAGIAILDCSKKELGKYEIYEVHELGLEYKKTLSKVHPLGVQYNQMIEKGSWSKSYNKQLGLYCFGRVQWNDQLNEEEIVQEWINSTMGKKLSLVSIIEE